MTQSQEKGYKGEPASPAKVSDASSPQPWGHSRRAWKDKIRVARATVLMETSCPGGNPRAPLSINRAAREKNSPKLLLC